MWFPAHCDLIRALSEFWDNWDKENDDSPFCEKVDRVIDDYCASQLKEREKDADEHSEDFPTPNKLTKLERQTTMDSTQRISPETTWFIWTSCWTSSVAET